MENQIHSSSSKSCPPATVTVISTPKCGHCSSPCSLLCSNCKKIAYCSKEHQKLHRKLHKCDCNPVTIKTDTLLGQHLVATRNIEPGEILFREHPLIIGPRSNLPKFGRICLGCCNQINHAGQQGHQSQSHTRCFICKWPVCGSKCEQSSVHKDFECPILSENDIPEPKTQEEYLYITILRCLLLRKHNQHKWEQLLNFESHVEARRRRQTTSDSKSQHIYQFLKNKCKLSDVTFELVDFIYGVFLVNGYGDSTTFSVKLYPKASKISNACVPNTRTTMFFESINEFRLGTSTLQILATVPIKCGHPLTQLYGKLFKGTTCRQELFQNIYYFTCSCERCIDPTELNTYLSSVKCTKCNSGMLLPKNPLSLDVNSAWACNSCSNVQSYASHVLPALTKVHVASGGSDLGDLLYSEYEVYGQEDEAGNNGEFLAAKLTHVQQMLAVLSKLQTQVVHKNHYALLPLKTALVATIHSLLRNSKGKIISSPVVADIKNLLPDFHRMVQQMLEVVNVIFPGLTSERGILLFYNSEALKFLYHEQSEQVKKQIRDLQKEATRIMMLQPENDSQRQLVLKYIAD